MQRSFVISFARIAVGLISIVGLVHPGGSSAADFYVDQMNAAASDNNPGTASLPWRSIAKANQVLAAGDTVYIKQGNYPDYIVPANSGTPVGTVNYRNYSNDVVTIQNAAYGIHLDGKSWIVVQGITFTNLDQMMILENSANNNVITNCNFLNMRTLSAWAGSRIWFGSCSNRVDHCVFANWGQCSGGDAFGTLFEIGWDDVTMGTNVIGSFNIVQNSTFYHGGHDTMEVNGNHNIIRNNYMYNDPWTVGKGERTLAMIGLGDALCRLNLVEGNRFGWSSVPCDTWCAPGVQIAESFNIIRKNYFFYNDASGLQFSVTDSYLQGPCFNHVYNNSFMGNGWQLDPQGLDDQQRSQIGFQNWSTLYSVRSNYVKNNLFYNAVRVYGYNGPNATDQFYANNYNGDASGDPKFANAALVSTPITATNAADSTYPNLSLLPGSPAIDAGGPITTITSPTGFGTTFTVADAAYFSDGWGIAAGDVIQLLSSAQRAQITNVNYATGIISVSSNLTWSNGQGIALAYEGTAPDIGAFESGAGTNAAPIVSTLASQSIGFPTNVVTLTANATDPNGDPLSFGWSQIDGPAPALLSALNGTSATAVVFVSGAYLFRFSASDGVLASSADTTVTFGADPASQVFEAESGALAAPFVATNGYIFQAVQTTIVTNGGRAAYAFSLNQAGNYVVTCNVNAPNDSANSFFVNIDSEPIDPTMIWDIPVTAGFEARTVCWRGTGGSTGAQFNPKFFPLSAGNHTLIVRGREAGAQLDRITISKAWADAAMSPPTNLHVAAGP